MASKKTQDKEHDMENPEDTRRIGSKSGHEVSGHDNHPNGGAGAGTPGMYKDLEQKYMEYQTLEQQSRQLQEQLQKASEQLYELEIIKQSLEDYDKVGKDKEMLSPISSGILVKSRVLEPGVFYVNVGANVMVKKSLPEVKNLLDSQAEQLRVAHDRLILGFNQVNVKLQALEKELIKMTGEA